MKKYICFLFLPILLLLLVMQACNKDFLDRPPLDAIGTAGGLTSTSEMRFYMNQFYKNAVFGGQPSLVGGEGIAFDDARSDNMIFANVDTRLNGQLSISNSTRLSDYDQIRAVNWFLENCQSAAGIQADKDQLIGEAYFFRAWFYFNMLKDYGGVTWVNKVLPDDTALMQVARDTRTLITDSIISDLNKAGTLLTVQSNSAGMRIHSDIALAMISRVALYEGTWEKYHKSLQDPFYTTGITDAKIKSYFEIAREAAQRIIKSGRWHIYATGNPFSDYSDLFIQEDLSSNAEVMFWKKYDATQGIGNSLGKYLSTGGAQMGLTQSLVDDYLTADGRPFGGYSRDSAQAIYSAELQPSLRDSRLSQTVVKPGDPLQPGVIAPPFPPLDQSSWSKSVTGFGLHKFLPYNDASAASTLDNKSSVPAIYFRYAEVLLNYAEAAAELGDDPAVIASALNPLRARVGMPNVDFDREYNTDPGYPFRKLNKVLQSVRRERRVELACEGFRFDDIMRWAAAGDLIVNRQPLGVLFIGSNLGPENTKAGFYRGNLYYDTPPSGHSINLYLSGNPGDGRRYVAPFKVVLPNGYGFDVKRDYLLPIQQRMLQLTGNKWTQNPGW